MGKASRRKRAFFCSKSILYSDKNPVSYGFVHPDLTDLDNLNDAVTYPDFETAKLSANELNVSQIAKVEMIGPFVLCPTGDCWKKFEADWVLQKRINCQKGSA